MSMTVEDMKAKAHNLFLGCMTNSAVEEVNRNAFMDNKLRERIPASQRKDFYSHVRASAGIRRLNIIAGRV